MSASLSKRIRKFFAINPGEELTRADMAVKFEVSERSIEDSLRVLKAEGAIVRVLVFRATPREGIQ